MPKANIGSLLENIVLFEAIKLLIAYKSVAVVDFINPFAMPPLSNWSDATDHSLSENTRKRVWYQLKKESEIAKLFEKLYDHDKDLGPSGSLLAALLLKQNELTGRFWLNDLPSDDQYLRYPDPPVDLGDVESAACKILKREKPADWWDIEICREPFPDSLTQLKNTLQTWNRSNGAQIRIGYLDPDSYTTNDPNPEQAQTDRESVKSFLQHLSQDFEGEIACVKYLYGTTTERRHELTKDLRTVGAETSYEFTSFGSGNHMAVVHYKGNQENFFEGLTQAVRGTWHDWTKYVQHRVKPYELQIQ